MIIYATKLTVERFKIELPEQMPSPQKEFIEGFIGREQDDRLLQWGAKLFYFDRRKCLEIANFASKFTLFLIDIKVSDLNNIGNYMANYISYIYRHDPEMLQLLDRFFKESPHFAFAKLTDKAGIAHLNHVMSDYALDGYRLYDFIEDGILLTRKFNEQFNTGYPVARTVDGKKTYVYPADLFKELLMARYPKSRRAVTPRRFRPA